MSRQPPLANVAWLALGARLGEQPGLGLDEDAAADQALEFGADVLGVLGSDRQVQGHAEVTGPEGTAKVGECSQDLLVGGVLGERRRGPGRGVGRRGVVLAGEGQEGLSGDLQVADRLADLAEPGSKPVDAGLDVAGLACECLLAGVDPVQQVPARVRRGHAARQEGTEVPVSRRAITSVIAQYTRDTELEGRCS